MIDLLNYLKQNLKEDWLIGYSNAQTYQLTEYLFKQFIYLSKEKSHLRIFIIETESIKFIASFIAGVSANCYIFLCNFQWKQQEWKQVFDLVKPDLIIGNLPENITQNFPSSSFSSPPLERGVGEISFQRGVGGINSEGNNNDFSHNSALIMIPTGGSSGNIRFAIHAWETLTASVEGFCHYFAKKSINSCCVLPLYHVSGLMQFLRSFLSQGKLLTIPYQTLKSGEISLINPEDFFISLVPTQLQFLLQSNPHWLAQFKTVLLGGAPAWKSLLDQARQANIRLSLTYGMTETASQIVTLKPEDFRDGNNSNGRVLHQAQINIINETGIGLETNQIGVISIKSDSLCLGYYPDIFIDRSNFLTDDLVFFDEQGYLHIIGRNSQKIITGGENVFPAEVEAAILATELVKDICIIGLPDEKWGQVVTAIYVPQSPNISEKLIKLAIVDKISKFKQPKYWIQVETIPRNSQGKLNYQELQKFAQDTLI